MTLIQVINSVNEITEGNTNDWTILITTLPIEDAFERRDINHDQENITLIEKGLDEEYQKEITESLTKMGYNVLADLQVQDNTFSIYIFPTLSE